MGLSIDDFPTFFQAVYGVEPFPWQSMLATRVHTEGVWPLGIDLPTASGKTACLDIAIFTLALSVNKHNKPSLPRRVFFVVDRRVVVDAAHERATRLKQKLEIALKDHQGGIVREVAARLARIGSGGKPLHVSRQRGGVLRDDAWVLDPTQPAIVTGTVDQIGSRLLFRGYGPAQLSQSIHASLVAIDSLILLDEAHCAQPFMQTAEWVRRYVGKDWRDGDLSIPQPLQFVVLSATLHESATERCFPDNAQNHQKALDHPILRVRFEATKPARLIAASKAPSKPKMNEHGVRTFTEAANRDHLVAHAANLAVQYVVDRQRRRIAVMVNRVATATAIYQQLRNETDLTIRDDPLDATVLLLTGRMRPIDRDDVLRRLQKDLKAGSRDEPERPIILVTTQCLEVGADFDFDALITECASLDALRQRFGRLNRLGAFPETDAAILHRKKPGMRHDDDPIYGKAMDATWKWLHDKASKEGKDHYFDFGIAAVENVLPKDEIQRQELLKSLNAPSPDAPTLLPAHVDLLCQTAPRPAPDPDVSLFLHGVNRSSPEAHVVFRADLIWNKSLSDSENGKRWLDAVSLVRPVTTEMLTVPLFRLKQWLAGKDLRLEKEDTTSDVEHQRIDIGDDASFDISCWYVRWRGVNRSDVLNDPKEIAPNDVIVLPADEERAIQLGHYFNRPDDAMLDVAERAYPSARGHAVLRINNAVLRDAATAEPVQNLLEYVTAQRESEEAPEPAELAPLLMSVAEHTHAQLGVDRVPAWLAMSARHCAEYPDKTQWWESHPIDGIVLRSARLKSADRSEIHDEFADEDDTGSEIGRAVSLMDHSQNVEQHAKRFAASLVPTLEEDIALAARLHDLGKADERFQAVLHNSPLGCDAGANILAKSGRMPRTSSARRRLRRQLLLPNAFRHEMLSMQLAERWPSMPDDPLRRDLVLHLIASHHGHARPFAPVSIDDDPPSVQIALDSFNLAIDSKRRRECPAHRLDSGVAERFWRLTRRYGWWGLAYLEAILRLADWRASAEEAVAAQNSLSVQRENEEVAS